MMIIIVGTYDWQHELMGAMAVVSPPAPPTVLLLLARRRPAPRG
jgi:hypothetical protein